MGTSRDIGCEGSYDIGCEGSCGTSQAIGYRGSNSSLGIACGGSSQNIGYGGSYGTSQGIGVEALAALETISPRIVNRVKGQSIKRKKEKRKVMKR